MRKFCVKLMVEFYIKVKEANYLYDIIKPLILSYLQSTSSFEQLIIPTIKLMDFIKSSHFTKKNLQFMKFPISHFCEIF